MVEKISDGPPVMINSDLVQVKYKKNKAYLNKPIVIGFTILELARNKMIKFFYDIFVPLFGADDVTLLYSDTDSYYLEVAGYDYEEIVKDISAHIDFSNFPPNHVLYDASKRCQFDYLKIDTKSHKIMAFQGCRKKCYKLYLNGGQETLLPLVKGSKIAKKITKVKGVPKTAIANQIKNSDFMNSILKEGHIAHVVYNKIQSKRHTLYFLKQRKIALTSFDNSSFYKSCGVCSMPFGSVESAICNDIHCKYVKLLLKTWNRIDDS